MVPEWTEEWRWHPNLQNPLRRWTAKRRVALVVSILKGKTSVAEAARPHGLTVAEVEDWLAKFLLGARRTRSAVVPIKWGGNLFSPQRLQLFYLLP